MNTLFALIKREILEHSNIWRVPLILIGISLLLKLSLLFGNYSIDIDVPDQLQLDDEINTFVSSVLGKALHAMNYIIMLTMFTVAIFYSIACLYNERQDQSVLFWRSLPISDSLTVASKFLVGLTIIPVIVVVCQAVVSVLFLGTDSIEYLANYYGESLTNLLKVVLWSLMPIVAWCVLCSEIAKKTPFLLAFISPIILILVDKLFFSGVISKTFIINRLTGMSHYSLALLFWGVVFSMACFFMAVVKRSQRI